MSSTDNSKSLTSETVDRVHHSNNIVKITSYPLQKYLFFQEKELSLTLLNLKYEGSDISHTERSSKKYIQDNYHTERSHGEKYIELY